MFYSFRYNLCSTFVKFIPKCFWCNHKWNVLNFIFVFFIVYRNIIDFCAWILHTIVILNLEVLAVFLTELPFPTCNHLFFPLIALPRISSTVFCRCGKNRYCCVDTGLKRKALSLSLPRILAWAFHRWPIIGGCFLLFLVSWILSYAYTYLPGVNPIWCWCTIPFVCSWIQLASILLRVWVCIYTTWWIIFMWYLWFWY